MRIAICEDEEVVAQQIWGYLFDKEEIEAQYFLEPEKQGNHFGDSLFFVLKGKALFQITNLLYKYAFYALLLGMFRVIMGRKMHKKGECL